MIKSAIKRIEKMEICFDTLKAAAERDRAAVFEDAALRELLRELAEYYEGGWLRDYELDEQGLIPSDIKRGVLSQDAVYDFLQEINGKE